MLNPGEPTQKFPKEATETPKKKFNMTWALLQAPVEAWNMVVRLHDIFLHYIAYLDV